MSSALRTSALIIGGLFLVACSNDKAPEDILAEDSTLAREIMSAKADSVEFKTDSTPSDTILWNEAPLSTIPSNTSPSTSIASNAAFEEPTKPARSVRRVATARKTGKIHRTARSVASTSITEAAPRVKTTPLTYSALLPAGTELSLTADQRICASMSRVGDTFATRTAADVVGPIGVVIPKGTPALAQVASVRKNFDVDMMSLALQGRSYTLASDVTHTDVERVRRKSSLNKSKVAAGAGIGAVAGGVIGGNPATTVLGAAAGGLAGAVATRRPATQDECVPEGGRIDVKLTEPLRVSLSD